ncbi:hypothetical protein ACWKWP_16325 [Agromyces soli]
MEPLEQTGPMPPRDWAAELRSGDRAVVRRAAASLLAETTRAVRGLRWRMGLGDADVQDAVGETMLELAKRIHAGHPVPGAIVQKVATAVCSRFVNGPVRHETAKALRILKQRVAAAEASAGGALSSRAVAAIAEEVRLGPDFNPRHRPVERFHLVEGFSKPVSIDRYDPDVVDQLLARSASAAGRSGEFDPFGGAGACERLLERVQQGRCTKKEARAVLWVAFAADEGLPAATPGRIQRRVAADLLAYVEALPDGVASACLDRLEGRTTRATIALFAPFAELGGHEMDAIAEALWRRRAFAMGIWASAVAVAQAPAQVPGSVAGRAPASPDGTRSRGHARAAAV